MNILVVTSYHYQGTLYPSAIFIHEQMRAYVRAGHHVRAIVLIPWGKRGDNGKRFGPAIWKETVDNIEHVFLRHFSFSNYGVMGLNQRCANAAVRRHIAALLKDFSPDVIHGQALGSADAAALFREATGCPAVVTNHGETRCDEPWCTYPERIAPAANQADQIVCVSSLLERQMQSAGVTVLVRTILNGFHIQQTKPVYSPGRRLSWNYTGWLRKPKHADITIQAFAKVAAKQPGSSLTIVGSGVEETALKTLCAELGITPQVHFLGYLDNQSAICEMKKSRFFVMPSHPEGFGIVYLEAMVSGCITIGTQGEGIADLIETGKNGFLVPPDDPDAIVDVVDWCLSHPAEADAIAQRGKADALALTWDRNAEQYIKLFEELMK